MPDERIGIIGGGRVGQALGRLLGERGMPVAAVASRTLDGSRLAARFIGGEVAAVSCEQMAGLVTHVLIATPDGTIADVARTLAESGMRGGVVLHTCGAYGVEVLEPLAGRGTARGVLHPLQTIPSREAGLKALDGVAFAIDGDEAAAEWAPEIVRVLNGIPLRIAPDKKALYHAAAVVASNYTVGLLDAAIELMERAGVSEADARKALRPLVEASVANALARSPKEALTGPIRRGDTATVVAHLAALPGHLDGLYRAVGVHTVEVARRAGLDEAAARELLVLLRENEGNDA